MFAQFIGEKENVLKKTGTRLKTISSLVFCLLLRSQPRLERPPQASCQDTSGKGCFSIAQLPPWHILSPSKSMVKLQNLCSKEFKRGFRGRSVRRFKHLRVVFQYFLYFLPSSFHPYPFHLSFSSFSLFPYLLQPISTEIFSCEVQNWHRR